jgi:hemerythrin-like domain-containing protein
MLYYIREYPEKIHHPKEDRYLFATLRKRTDEFNDVLDELEREHVEDEGRLRNLEHALTRFELKGSQAAMGLKVLMEQYASFCFNHRQIEETVILPAAKRLFTEIDWARIDVAFEDRDDPFGESTFEGENLDGLFRLIANAIPEVSELEQRL